MGKSTINGPFSNSKLLVYQRLSTSHNLPQLGPQPASKAQKMAIPRTSSKLDSTEPNLEAWCVDTKNAWRIPSKNGGFGRKIMENPL